MNKINAEIKRNSVVKVFDCVCSQGNLSRREIEKLTGLSWGTVSAVCAELTDRHVFDCFKGNSCGRGRVSELLTINQQENLCLGIDINAGGITFVVCDLAGNLLEHVCCELSQYDADSILALIIARAKEFTDKYSAVWSVSLSMQGQIDSQNGISVHVDQFSKWNDIPLTDLLHKELKLPIYLYHDPDCLMSYHRNVDRLITNEKNAAIIRLDDGVGMSLLIDGKSIEGDGVVAEIGHTCIVPNGLKCSCGKAGCLEAYVALCALANCYSTNFHREVNVREFLQLLRSSDMDACNILRERMQYLGIALANLSNLVNLQKIIISGTLGNSADLFVGVVEETFKRNTANSCEFVSAEFASIQPAIGACLKTVLRFKDKILFD